MDTEYAKQWFIEKRPNYESLTALAKGTIESLLKTAGIDFLYVSNRTKTIESFLEKIDRKGYSDLESEMTDISGARIVTYIESDVDKVCKIIENSFIVHEDKSLNKSEELEVDRFGYRSVHYVCDLGKDRFSLPEYKLFKDMLFEIQVRTVLQHAWAEIEHDRSYKFSGELPSPLKRRFYLIAGILEIADREFNSIADELDRYSIEVINKTQKGELDVEVNTTSLIAYLYNSLSKAKGVEVVRGNFSGKIIKELNNFGINTLSDLSKIMNNEFWSLMKKHKTRTTYLGLLRAAMMLKDINLYFEKAWIKNWKAISRDTYNLLSENLGKEEVDQIISTYNLMIH